MLARNVDAVDGDCEDSDVRSIRMVVRSNGMVVRSSLMIVRSNQFLMEQMGEN